MELVERINDVVTKHFPSILLPKVWRYNLWIMKFQSAGLLDVLYSVVEWEYINLGCRNAKGNTEDTLGYWFWLWLDGSSRPTGNALLWNSVCRSFRKYSEIYYGGGPWIRCGVCDTWTQRMCAWWLAGLWLVSLKIKNTDLDHFVFNGSWNVLFISLIFVIFSYSDSLIFL